MRMGGGPQQFGIDVEQVPALLRELAATDVELLGYHVFAGSQNLHADILMEAQRKTADLVLRMADAMSTTPTYVNLGGGFGIPYFAGDAPLDVEAIGGALGRTLEDARAVLPGARFALELGRWLVGEAGVYLTRIVDRKVSHGELFLVVDGGLHHQLAASGNFGTVVRRNYPVALAGRFDAAGEEEATIVGCLCTPLDRLADKVAFPRAEPGAVVAVFLAGAYGATASPQAFLGHPPARELLVDGDAAAGVSPGRDGA
jgi:diaminopimelate decarboxylase